VPVWRVGLFALALAVGWLVAGGIVVAAGASELRQARAEVTDLDADAILADPDAAAQRLDRLATHFERARRHLNGVLAAPVRVLPWVGRDVTTAGALAASGSYAARGAASLAAVLIEQPGGLEALAPDDGGFPLDRYEQVIPAFRQSAALLTRGVMALEGAQDAQMVDALDDARAQLTEVLPGAASAVSRAAEAMAVIPDFAGARGPRRYLFLAQNPAEMRGTGGFIGAYSVLTMEDGRFSFSDFNEIHELPAFPADFVEAPSADFAARYNRYGGAGFWHNINMTPDFPTAGRAMLNLYREGTGDTLDGVIAVDPHALRALLAVSGAVQVPGFGEVDADNVVDVVSNRAHAEIADSEARKQLLGAVAVGAFEGVLAGSRPTDPVDALRALAQAASGGHLLLRAAEPDMQAAFVRAGVAGELQRPAGDGVAVIANAGSAAKLDYYVDRTIAYHAELAADGSISSRAAVTIDNHAPSAGIDRRVIGPNASGLRAGEQRFLLSFYAPAGAAFLRMSPPDEAAGLQQEAELGRPVYSTVTQIRAGASKTVEVAWARQDGWDDDDSGGGSYRLTLQTQPGIRHARATAVVRLPPGMVPVRLTEGLVDAGDGTVRFDDVVTRVRVLQVDFRPDEMLN